MAAACDLRLGPAAVAAACLLAPACTSRGVPPEIEPVGDAAWESDGEVSVWESRGVRVVAYRDVLGDSEFTFCARVENRRPDAVVVTLRPVDVAVPPGAPVGRLSARRALGGSAFTAGAAFEVGPLASDEPAPEFRLHRTTWSEGPAPFTPDCALRVRCTDEGVRITEHPGWARLGDVAHYEIVLTAGGEVWTCDYRMRVVPGPWRSDLPALWSLPFAIALAPIGIPLFLLGAHH